jgi:hypothetical protein
MHGAEHELVVCTDKFSCSLMSNTIAVKTMCLREIGKVFAMKGEEQEALNYYERGFLVRVVLTNIFI